MIRTILVGIIILFCGGLFEMYRNGADYDLTIPVFAGLLFAIAYAVDIVIEKVDELIEEVKANKQSG